MCTYVYRRLGVKQTHTDLIILQVRIFPLENTSTISKFSIISMFTKSIGLLLILFFLENIPSRQVSMNFNILVNQFPNDVWEQLLLRYYSLYWSGFSRNFFNSIRNLHLLYFLKTCLVTSYRLCWVFNIVVLDFEPLLLFL